MKDCFRSVKSQSGEAALFRITKILSKMKVSDSPLALQHHFHV